MSFLAGNALHASAPGIEDWAATCDAQVLQRRMSARDAAAVRALFDFGHLIGNTDMHFGNLSLWADDPAKPQLTLAPHCDRLPR